MKDNEIKQIIEESLKPQREINKFVIAIFVAIIPAIIAAAGKLTFEIALLFEIPIIIIYSIWSFTSRSRNNSLIDWDRFYDILVIEKSKLDLLPSTAWDNLFNNYITFLYLTALYEGKDKFAQELWDKAAIKYNKKAAKENA